MRAKAIGWVLFGALALGGCDSGGGGGDPDGGGGGGTDTGPVPRLDAGGPGVDAGGGPGWPRTLTATIGPITVAPRDEDTVCVTTELPIDVGVMAVEARAFIGPGSHHLIVYRTTSAGTAEPSPCRPFVNLLAGDEGPLVMAQSTEQEAPIPDGVGFRIAPHQRVRLEMHYINTGTEPIEASGRLEVVVRPDDGTLQEADYAFFGTTNIYVDAHSTGSAEMFARSPAGGEPMNVFAVSSHTHAYATRTTVERADSLTDTTTTVVHESLDYAEPPITEHVPPLVFDGSDGFLLRCEYDNPTGSPIGFGDSATAEMCFVISLYYPSRGFLLYIE